MGGEGGENTRLSSIEVPDDIFVNIPRGACNYWQILQPMLAAGCNV